MALLLSQPELVRLARALGGVPVFGCLPGSPAARAGIGYGDIVLSIDGHPTASWTAYADARDRCANPMRVHLFRAGTELDIDVELERGAPLDVAGLLALTARDDDPA